MIRAIALACVCALLCACSKPAPATAETAAAQRVVTFAPHLAEMVFAVGAGEQLVGVSAWSDFPREVLELPEIGDAFTIDQEQLSLLQPDLLLVWESGMPRHVIDELRNRGYRVEVIQTRGLGDISAALLRIGELTGRFAEAEASARRFESELDELRALYEDAAPIDVFFQITARPLYTINRRHFISELISICGGQNVFADLHELAPSVSVEAVLDRNPEVMLAGTTAGDDVFDDWTRWSALAANRYGNQFLLPDETISRATPRLGMAGRSLCLALEQARKNRAAYQ